MTETTPLPEATASEAPEANEAAEQTPEASAAAAPTLSPAEVASQLKALFPALFTGMQKPLKLRIQADIQQRAPGKFTKAQLSAFLRRHTGSTGYLIALGKATHRYDLDGNAGDELLEEHRLAAREELKRRRGVQQEREALENQQRMNRAQLLRDFQRTTLTEANFCVLKGLSPEELPGILEIAKREAAERPAMEPQQAREPRPDLRRQPRREGGGGRPGGKPGNGPTSAPKAGRRNASR
ncbi:ProQ/FinO family protein [Pelomonas sp. V22]|uniref:ProQ/FinO family protein n=1 Tax=Pelomonas sp. V22 TaxID=2822139 RepID=UPI0024A96B09|nr:ProQ/FinO family protein [Pelomonas sp. V22]MDI4634526.1 ProQ/FinO family protein [Pelomonas sp. V22]